MLFVITGGTRAKRNSSFATEDLMIFAMRVVMMLVMEVVLTTDLEFVMSIVMRL